MALETVLCYLSWIPTANIQEKLWKENSVKPAAVQDKKAIAQAQFDIWHAIQGQDSHTENFGLSKLIVNI